MHISRNDRMMAQHHADSVEVKVLRRITPTTFLVETMNGLVEQWVATVEPRFVLLRHYEAQELQPALRGSTLDKVA